MGVYGAPRSPEKTIRFVLFKFLSFLPEITLTATSTKELPSMCPAGWNLMLKLSDTDIHCLYLHGTIRFFSTLI